MGPRWLTPEEKRREDAKRWHMSQKDPREESELRRKLREHMAQQESAKQPTQPARRLPAPKAQQPPRRPPAGPPKRPQVGRPPAAPSRSRRKPLGIYIPWWGILIVVGGLGFVVHQNLIDLARERVKRWFSPRRFLAAGKR